MEEHLLPKYLALSALQGSKEWSIDDMKNSLSEQALTAAVMPRYQIEMAVKRLGHANLATTADMYSHVAPTMQREAASKLNALLANS